MDAPDTVTGPINIGNPGEFTIRQLAEIVIEMTGSRSEIVQMPLPQQGNRISDLGEELCEVSVLPAGPFDFDT
jgi:nucleoside-diphosphate-sugar epimerase